MLDLVNRRCSILHCGKHSSKIKDKKHYCVPCYAQSFPLEPTSTRFKSKELHVKQYLESLNLLDQNNEEIKFVHDKAVSDGCSRRRPDFLIRMPMFNIIIEVDEFKHEGYDTTCEISRLNNLYEDLGMMPLIMIRFNPDAYTSNGI